MLVLDDWMSEDPPPAAWEQMICLGTPQSSATLPQKRARNSTENVRKVLPAARNDVRENCLAICGPMSGVRRACGKYFTLFTARARAHLTKVAMFSPEILLSTEDVRRLVIGRDVEHAVATPHGHVSRPWTQVESGPQFTAQNIAHFRRFVFLIVALEI